VLACRVSRIMAGREARRKGLMMDITFSFGGGTQSAAICVLIKQGRLPQPTRIVMADTGREASETWDYLNNVIKPMGFDVQIAGHDLATVDLYGTRGDMLLPAFTENGRGKLATFCSVEWKQRVIRRYLKAQGITQTTMWMGMSLDEIDRMRVSDVKWIKNHYPLVFDVPLRRHECIKLVEDYGLPTPPKSSCWMCPHRKDSQWRKLRDEYPQDWQTALELDRQITASHAAYLHESGTPLETADIDTVKPEQPGLFGDECTSGFCFT
jgi:hypothetical protein